MSLGVKLFEANSAEPISYKKLIKYGQYKADIFSKLNFSFEKGKKILDVGCGDGTDAEIFLEEYKLDTYGVDVYAHGNISKQTKLKFQMASILDLPFQSGEFDYVFAHDVLHHVDEKNQSQNIHLKALLELKRVVKKKGIIILVEGNRYNPLFYPHMVKMLGHDHWTQKYFEETIRSVYEEVEFKYFEAHSYPWAISFWKIYEYFMEHMAPSQFLAYNVALIRN